MEHDMTDTRRIKRKQGGLTNSALVQAARQFLVLKEDQKTVASRVKEMRDRLIDWVEQYGYTDDKGHFVLELPETVEGVTSFVRQRRASQTLREDDLMELLTKKNLLDDCTTMVRVVDEDAVYRAVFQGDLTEDELNSCVDEKVTWALVPSSD